MQDTNPVTKPSHYQFNQPCNEVRDVIRDRLAGYFLETGDTYLMYDYSNAIKYLLRWYAKNTVEDLKKARYCINTMLEFLEKE
jgi:retron-type reverse transcriptase